MLISRDLTLSENNNIVIRDIDGLTLHDDQILPLAYYLENKSEILKTISSVKIWLNGNDDLLDIIDDLENISLIALEFPKFADGRAFSIARLLKDKYGFKGVIRGFGKPIADQAQFMFRCGFDDIEIPANDDASAWQSESGRMNRFYQHLDDATPSKNRYQVS